MDYTGWPELHLNPPPNPNPNPNPNPLPIEPHSSYFSYYPSNPPNPPTNTSYPPHDPSALQMDNSFFSYYSNSNALCWAATEPLNLETGIKVPSNGTEQLTTANANSTFWTNPTGLPKGNGIWKNRLKKAKIVQSAYCEICGVDCNSKDILEKHKLGKKHKKSLEKLKAATVLASGASVGSTNPVIGPPENPNKGKTMSGLKIKKNISVVEDLETKRRKVVQGGAAVEAVRTCVLCNVVCNSQTVFNHHLTGQKHAAMVKKYAIGSGVTSMI